MPNESDERWTDLATRFEGYSQVPRAMQCAALLRQAMPRWEDRVVVSPYMHSLVFAAAAMDRRSEERVRVQWSDGTFEFTLTRTKGGQESVVAADRCRTENGSTLLDAFLVQLTGGEVPIG